ncbi:MAG: hypothetical protein FJX78_07205 [Armatimonadetes bacterium]|nr:hypothetical protein [Armatimonadota bacterium]
MRWPRRPPRWHAPAPSFERGAGVWRVTAHLGGDDIFMEADRPLVAKADAIAVQLALPVFASRASLTIDADLDGELDENLARVREVAAQYWQMPGGTITPSAIAARSPEGKPAIFFTGDVDSFYTLRRRQSEIETLIFVHGFEVPLADVARWQAVAAGVRQVAAALSLDTAFPRTNLRNGRWFNRLPWETTQVAALASVAHTMALAVGRVYVASSDVPPPYGSTPELDPLWSSGAVAIVNDGSASTRLDKVRAIADWPLVHERLRVCWEHRAAALNCGVCETCVRTQGQFAAAGALGRLRVFPTAPLAARIDGVAKTRPHLAGQWREIRSVIDEREITAAIDRLLARSGIAEDARKRGNGA